MLRNSWSRIISRTKKHYYIVIAIAGLLAIVGLGMYYTFEQPLSDGEVREKVYDDSYKVPKGFFTPRPEYDMSVNYFLYKTSPDSGYYCTNNFEEAKKTMAQDLEEYNIDVDNNDRPYAKRILTKSIADSKFSEFIVNESYPEVNFQSLYRIFKCDYISDFDREQYRGYYYNYRSRKTSPQIHIGTFARRPVTKENSLELVGVLWSVANANMGGAKVLSSSTREALDSVRITLVETQKSGGDWGMADSISVHKSIYTINKNTGDITYSEKDMRSMEGRMREGPL